MSLAAVRFIFFNDTATTEIYTLSLHDALPISALQIWMPVFPPTQAHCDCIPGTHALDLPPAPPVPGAPPGPPVSDAFRGAQPAPKRSAPPSNIAHSVTPVWDRIRGTSARRVPS